MRSRILQVPYGTADILPGEAAARRKMEDHIAATFTAWGFEEVATPTFEYLATFGGGGRVSDSNFKFFDRQNNTLMLRTDMTAPIARLVATRLQGEAGVKRLSYRAQLFRYEEAQSGRQCEFTQAGIEMMGEAGPAADAEVIALAVTALQEAGLTHFTLSVGQVAFIDGLAKAAAFDIEQVQKFKHCLITHNAVGLKNLVREQHLAGPLAQVMEELLFLQGDAKLLADLAGILTEPQCLQALVSLQEMYKLTEAYGVAAFVTFDLGLLRDFDYYTGMIFEGYTPELGYPIIGGGRYDKMMAAFGSPCPAIGFALGVDRIALALARAGKLEINRLTDLLVAYQPGALPEAIKACMDLRAQGQSVKLAPRPCSKDETPEAQMKVARCCAYTLIGKAE